MQQIIKENPTNYDDLFVPIESNIQISDTPIILIDISGSTSSYFERSTSPRTTAQFELFFARLEEAMVDTLIMS